MDGTLNGYGTIIVNNVSYETYNQWYKECNFESFDRCFSKIYAHKNELCSYIEKFIVIFFRKKKDIALLERYKMIK